MCKSKSLIFLIIILIAVGRSEDESLVNKDNSETTQSIQELTQLITSTSEPKVTNGMNSANVTTHENSTEKSIKNEDNNTKDDSTSSTVAYISEMTYASSSIPTESTTTTKIALESPSTVITQFTTLATISSKVLTESTTNAITSTTSSESTTTTNESLPTTSAESTTSSDFTSSTVFVTTESTSTTFEPEDGTIFSQLFI